MIRIAIEYTGETLSPEIDAVLKALSGNPAAQVGPVNIPVTVELVEPNGKKPKKEKTVKVEEPQQILSVEPAAEQPTETPADPENEDKPEETEGEQETFTLEEVRAEMTKLSQSGKMTEMKKILNHFGAEKLSALDPKHYAEAVSMARAVV